MAFLFYTPTTNFGTHDTMGSWFSRRSIGADAIPRNVTTLSVSWLNTEFKAAAVHRGRVEATWQRPGVSDGPGNFESYVREAIDQTGYHGHSVSLVLAHPRLVQQLVDAPPVRGSALQKVIQRYAQQQKVFPGEAAWASQTSPYGKGMQQVVLHLFPRQVLGQLNLGCRRCGVHLTSVLPTSAVLHHQMTQLPLEKDEVALLAADTGGSTTLVIGRRDGQILLARTLPGSWNEDAERLVLDLNRTVLYANQQFGGEPVRAVWLFGRGASDHARAMEEQIHFPVRTSPVPTEPYYWAVEALKLRPEFSPNFISPELQKAPQRRVFAKVVAASTVLVTLACLGASYYFLTEARRHQETVNKLSAQMTRLEAARNQLEILDNEMTRKKQVIRLILGERPPPTPAWLLAYMGEAVPPDLVVTNFHVKREEDHYRVQIAGTLQTNFRQPAVSSMEESLAQLKTRLAGAPFHLQLADKTQAKQTATARSSEPRPAGADGTGANWLSRFFTAASTKPPQAKPIQEDHFVIEGVLP